MSDDKRYTFYSMYAMVAMLGISGGVEFIYALHGYGWLHGLMSVLCVVGVVLGTIRAEYARPVELPDDWFDV